MSDWALELPRPALSPLDLVLAVLEEARHRIGQTIADALLQHRLGTLEDLVTGIVRETRATFREPKGDEDLGERMLAFGRGNWAAWSDTIRTALKMAESAGFSLDQATTVSQGPVALRSMGREAHVHLRHLPSEARAYVRATVFLMAEIFDKAAGKYPHAISNEFVDTINAPIDAVDPVVVVMTACMQVLTVAGAYGGIDKRVSVEVAGGLWHFFCAGTQDPEARALGFTEEVVEDSLHAARVAEAEATDRRAAVEWALRRRTEIELPRDTVAHIHELLANPPKPAPALLKILSVAKRG